jgi:hypothetical protein
MAAFMSGFIVDIDGRQVIVPVPLEFTGFATGALVVRGI